MLSNWKPDIILRCNFCNKTVLPQDRDAELPPGTRRETSCQTCGRGLPRCTICLLPVSIPHDALRNSNIAAGHSTEDTFDYSLLFCQSCRHGGHACHIREWFEGSADSTTQPHDTCPVADCNCHCLNEPPVD